MTTARDMFVTYALLLLAMGAMTITEASSATINAVFTYVLMAGAVQFGLVWLLLWLRKSKV